MKRFDKKNYLSSSSASNLNPKDVIKKHNELNKKLKERDSKGVAPTTYK